MRFSLSSTGLQEWNGDVLAVGLPQGDVETTATALEQRFAGITEALKQQEFKGCLLYTSPSPRDLSTSRMPSSA